MKFISTALLLLSSGLCVDAKKNSHGFDPNFLKAMNQGSKHSDLLRKVTVHERKEFWKNLLKKAKPASEANLRAAKRKLEDANGNNQNKNYNNGNYNGNGNYQNYNGNGNNYQNGQYNNYGNNDVNYNYNGNGQYNYNNQRYYNDQDYYWQDDQVQEEDETYPGVDWSNLGFDMTSYSLKYTGCSAVKTYDSNKAASEDYDTVLSTKRFALFRLCPSNNCNQYSVNGCGRNYGEYVLEMDSFLEGVVEFNRQRYWHYCHFCRRCNALESYGERMSELDEAQMEYYEEMQAKAEEYYEQQQAQYADENNEYGNENAANYQYYGNYGQNNQNNNYANYNNGQYNGDEAAEGEDGDAEGENGDARRARKLANNGNNYQQYNYRQYYQQNNGNNNQNGNGNNNNQNGGNNNRNYYNYQYQAECEDGQDCEEQEQQNAYDYWEQQGKNVYNNYYWDEELYGQWNDNWSETWLAFNWQVLPYCTQDELETCYNADEVCADYDEDFEQDADAMGGFSACTQIDDNYYIGPHCNSDGYTITLGVYSDAYCDEYVGDEVSLYDVLGYDIDEDFDFFPQECVSCEEGGEEKEFASFMSANQDFDTYEEWLDEKWEEYIEMAEQNYEENYGDEQNEWQAQQAAYYESQNYGNGQQQGYYYQNGRQYQNGGGSYYYGNQDQQQQYAQYGGQYYKNQQYAEQYGNYGASMLNQGMNFYYNRGMAGNWLTSDRYSQEQYEQQQKEEDADYYYYKQRQQTFANSGIADVCGALYTYAAKCNKHLSIDSSVSSEYSYGSWNQENNEELVCNFIDNLQTQKYDEYGNIIMDGRSSSKYSIDFVNTKWTDPDQVKAQAEKTGVTAGQAVGLALTMAACLVMSIWACCLHSTLARKNIPWRPKRGKNLAEPTDINRQHSGIVMGRSRSGMSAKATPLLT